MWEPMYTIDWRLGPFTEDQLRDRSRDLILQRGVGDMGGTRVDRVKLLTTTRHVPRLDSQAVDDMTEEVKGPHRSCGAHKVGSILR